MTTMNFKWLSQVYIEVNYFLPLNMSSVWVRAENFNFSLQNVILLLWESLISVK